MGQQPLTGKSLSTFSMLMFELAVSVMAWFDKRARLLLAIQRQDGRKIAELLATHPVLATRKRFGSYPLHWAAMRGVPGVCQLLVAKGANVNARDKNGRTALHDAVRAEQVEVAEALIALGADVNATDNNSFTPLHLTAAKGFKTLAQLLLERGADVNAKGGSFLATPSTIASVFKHSELERLFSSREQGLMHKK